jgi:hypothetical protein
MHADTKVLLIFIGSLVVVMCLRWYVISLLESPSKPEPGDYIDANGIVVATISKTPDESLTVTILNKAPNVNTTFIIGSDPKPTWNKEFNINDKVIKYKFNKKAIKKSETGIKSGLSLHFATLKE